MLAWGAYVHSPVYDEWWHLPSGIAAWREGRHDFYRINPPLVRLVAAVPILPFVAQDEFWEIRIADQFTRRELAAGSQFAIRYPGRVPGWVTLARWACIPFSLIGAFVCFRWAGELYGGAAGLAAAALWCFCPNILGHAQLITPDAGSAAMGLAAAYAYWKWLREKTWTPVILAGALLGLALLTKLTWVISLAIWPTLWTVWTIRAIWRGYGWRGIGMSAVQLAGIFVLAFAVLNAGYDFNGSFRRLDSYHFQSALLRGSSADTAKALKDSGKPIPTNRFANTLIGWIPVPFPEDYVLGVDRAKLDFEAGGSSYLRGEWRDHGWWYYYLYAAAIKVPLGTWLLGALGILLTIWKRDYRSWDEMAILIPGLSVFAFVSAETGFSHHLRYMLPAFPFALVWCSKFARSFELRNRGPALCGSLLLVWSILSSISVYPHSLSYFNELVGGPKGGHWHLDKSNTDWGQDVFFLKKWYDAHPEGRPLRVAFDGTFDPTIIGVKFDSPPVDKRSAVGRSTPLSEAGPLPGWYALSVNNLHARTHDYDYFLEFEPDDWIGYSMPVYHITLEECNRVRRKLGLPEVAE
jgi:hypothetical protein